MRRKKFAVNFCKQEQNCLGGCGYCTGCTVNTGCSYNTVCSTVQGGDNGTVTEEKVDLVYSLQQQSYQNQVLEKKVGPERCKEAIFAE